MCKLGFKEAEESEIKLPTFVGSHRKRGNSRKTSPSASLTMLKPLTMSLITNWEALKQIPVPDHHAHLLRSLSVSQDTTVRTRQGTMDWFHFGKGLKSLLMRVKEESKQVSLKVNMEKKKNLRSWHLVPSLHGKWKWKNWKQRQILFS